MSDEILTIEEVAQYLRVSVRTVYDWAQRGEIPAGKIGTVWRFKKNEVESWVNARFSNTQEEKKTDQVRIKNILSPDRICFINQSSKKDAIVQLSEVLASAPQIKNEAELIQEMLKREELMSTAIGKGIAIPHVRLSSVTDLVLAVGICKKDVLDFTPFDEEPVRILIMIAASYNQHQYYLKTISFLSGMLKSDDLRTRLMAAKTEKEVYEILTEDE